MNNISYVLRVAVSFALATDVLAICILLAADDDIQLSPIILIVAGGFTLFLGAPAYFVLRLYKQETWRSCIIAGFLIGAVPTAFMLLPTSGSAQIGQEVVLVAGVRTAAGWRVYAEMVAIAGGIGAAAGGVFWTVLRVLESGGSWSSLRRLSLTAGIGLAIAANWTIFAIPGFTMDRSCHNVLRDGRSSIGPVLFFIVELPTGGWSRLQDTAERFAATERWNIDESNDKDKAFSPRRFVSVCIEPGTEVRFSGSDIPQPNRVMISVFQPQGGNSWREPVRRLLTDIEAAFPHGLRRDFSDQEVQTPLTLLPQQ